MKKPFDISEEDKIKILHLHLEEKQNSGTRLSEQDINRGIRNDNPKQVVNSYDYDGKTTIITFNSDGSYSSNIPLIGNTKSLNGTWKYIPKSGTGGRIVYSSGLVRDGFIQEIGRDLIMDDGLQFLLNNKPSEYDKLPIMTKLLNLINSEIPQGRTGLSMVPKINQIGCPSGCVRDPNYQG
jgi:hypothetical protein